jgi:hypothetical protein
MKARLSQHLKVLSTSGTLLFMPALAALAAARGFRPVVLAVAAACLVLIPITAWLLPERPAAIGIVPYGALVEEPASVTLLERRGLLAPGALRERARLSRFAVSLPGQQSPMLPIRRR